MTEPTHVIAAALYWLWGWIVDHTPVVATVMSGIAGSIWWAWRKVKLDISDPRVRNSELQKCKADLMDENHAVERRTCTVIDSLRADNTIEHKEILEKVDDNHAEVVRLLVGRKEK